MTQLIVAKDGTGTFTSIQEAVHFVQVRENTCSQRIEILVKAGIYEEVVHIPKMKVAISLKGEGAEHTKLTYGNFAGKTDENGNRLGTGNSATLFVEGDDFYTEGMTFENSYYLPGLDCGGRQAVAVNTSGEREQFINCHFKGYQDTLYAREGSCYYFKCYIEGDIDFIFGGASAVFEDCEICSLYGGSDIDNGYVAAASTKAAASYGFLFENCQLTANEGMPDHTVYLGRPWHPSSEIERICVNMVYKNCQLGRHIKEEAWTFMGQVQPETERLYEFNNQGEGAFINTNRRQLTSEEALSYTKEKILPWLGKKRME